MEGTLWQLKYEGKEYTLDASDLTTGKLRAFKRWFGPEYGRFLPFIQMLIQGDGDACACALWVVRKRAGERNVPEPPAMDFAVGEMYITEEEPEDEAEGADPTNGSDTEPVSESEQEDAPTHD